MLGPFFQKFQVELVAIKPGRDFAGGSSGHQDFLLGIEVSRMTGDDLITLATKIDLQGLGNFAKVVDGEKEG